MSDEVPTEPMDDQTHTDTEPAPFENPAALAPNEPAQESSPFTDVEPDVTAEPAVEPAAEAAPAAATEAAPATRAAGAPPEDHRAT